MAGSSLTGLSPNDPNKYLGPNVALTVVVTRNRAPTGADYRMPETGKLYPFNSFWLVGKDPTTGVQGDLWYLSKIAANVAYWLQIPTTAATLGFTLNIQVFTASATYTPSANMVYAQVEGVGSGGGGGGVASTGVSQFAQAGGGGSGEYALGIFNAATIGASQAVTIGAAGAGGVAGNNTGSTGGTCSLGALLTLFGGIGGSGSAAAASGVSNNGGIGGTGGSGGSVRFPGAFGGSGYASPSDQLASGGFGAGGRYSGGVPQNGSTGAAGSTSTGFGGGGSGGSNKAVNVARAGGNGTAGIIVVTEYIATI